MLIRLNRDKSKLILIHEGHFKIAEAVSVIDNNVSRIGKSILYFSQHEISEFTHGQIGGFEETWQVTTSIINNMQF